MEISQEDCWSAVLSELHQLGITPVPPHNDLVECASKVWRAAHGFVKNNGVEDSALVSEFIRHWGSFHANMNFVWKGEKT